MKRASSPFPAEFSGMAYFPLPIPAETSYAECRRFSDSLPGNAVFMANPACPVMKEPIPIQQWLPAGPLRDMGEKYVSQLPDVAQNPIGPESLMHQSNHSWSEYLVAYSLLYPGVVIILALLGGLGLGAFFIFCRRREYSHRIFCSKCGSMMYPCGLHCPECGTSNPSPRALNWIGYSRLRTVVPPSGWKRHEEVLRSYRRCFYCGQPLREPSLDQRCPACGKAVLQGEQSVDRYDAYIGRRRGWTFAAVVVLGVVPILGPLLASSLYRRTLINPYSLYMTVYRESFLMVVLFLCRHLFRLLPFIGIIGMPVLCVTEYHLYRRMFLWKAEKYDFRGE
ncbi:hypothetical protein CXT84_07840 [Akkermansia muciniphila]|jgi:hypothetical protein|nr:hypothetical protein CXT84_07840 [Akkermansia muciniphila]